MQSRFPCGVRASWPRSASPSRDAPGSGSSGIAVACTTSAPSLGRILINRERCAESSGDLLPPSPPAEKAAARQDQAGKASADNWAGDRVRLGRVLIRSRLVTAIWIINVRFGPLCGLKSDITQGPRSAITGCERSQQTDSERPREHGVLKPNAHGLPHTEARSMSARSRNRPQKRKSPTQAGQVTCERNSWRAWGSGGSGKPSSSP
jgi:hypothetical protein